MAVVTATLNSAVENRKYTWVAVIRIKIGSPLKITKTECNCYHIRVLFFLYSQAGVYVQFFCLPVDNWPSHCLEEQSMHSEMSMLAA